MSATTSVPVPRHATGRPGASRARRLLRGPQADPRWARPALFGLLALTAVLYLWDLSRNGWANDFYAAAVQAGTKSWKAFFFGSFDQSSFITVDKTPGSLWVMELSGRIFGFSQWSHAGAAGAGGRGLGRCCCTPRSSAGSVPRRGSSPGWCSRSPRWPR